MTNTNHGGVNGKLVAAFAVTAAVFVPLTVFGAPAFARSASAASQYQYSGSSQYQYNVAVCHHTHAASHPWVQINVASAGWLHGHSKHRGDFLVTPASPCPPTTTPGSTGAPSGHGNDGSHGNDTHGSSSATQGSSDAHGSSGEAHGNANGAHGNEHGNDNNGNGNGHHP